MNKYNIFSSFFKFFSSVRLSRVVRRGPSVRPGVSKTVESKCKAKHVLKLKNDNKNEEHASKQ